MKKDNFALYGGPAAFDKPLPVGQLYFPSWERYEVEMRGIFERRYYTNQGPLVQKLEERLQDFLGVKHVICVTNATIGLMMAVEVLELSGKVILPSFTFIASAQSLSWTGVEPVFCDVDPGTHQLAIEKLDSLIDKHVSAIMGVNLWGGACDPERLEHYAKDRGLKLYFDSAHAFGCETDGKKIGGFGSLEVFSFHATKVLSATEGGCISTNDGMLAARLRNIRSSYGAGKSVPVVKTSNGRMSEAQAAIALMSFEDFPQNQQNNEGLFRMYDEGLRRTPGIKLVKPAGVTFSNYQYVVCEVDESIFGLSRDSLIKILKAENVNARRYFYPGAHRSIEYQNKLSSYQDSLPVTDHLCASCIQLPIGAMVDSNAVEVISEIINKSHYNSVSLRALLEGGSK
ncbi:DegT/DnrJ/EryC1/StrS family aminotransferase [Cycloclasticus zancles]|jgi:dTDP-4-amino-4,6-dideoxygalactose transaminase|uniref:Pyridoxal phosphate-dependent enzyme apparently involved in regulation of cell wall biogenesis n=1 Tax=Cycloclasticus zancles 78-ME TaxID=1198232 RepID=S5TDE8_9GAMM|nr:DegT/DnrJ/EryC1/StrS family aminotransferase [Cycloclasticus zancles]AGS38797.1 Pyridoxal phosphate-dependent enzyme apparently involved in regulation of cell wall biogenesis [Cycloclasticus zancles 78-ME]